MKNVFFIVALFLSCQGTISAQGLDPQVLERCKAATVFIKVVFSVEADVPPTERPQHHFAASGSGIVIGRTETHYLIVTNAHVLGPPKRPSYRKIEIVFDSGVRNSETVEPAIIVAQDNNLDLALLQVERNRLAPIVPMSIDYKTPVMQTTTVYALGYPFGQQLDRRFTNPAMTITKGSVSSIRKNATNEPARIQIDADINPGNSGGPVVDKDGNLIGIASSGILGTKINFCISNSILAKLFVGRISEWNCRSIIRKDKSSLRVDFELIDYLAHVKECNFMIKKADRPLPAYHMTNKPVKMIATKVEMQRIHTKAFGKFDYPSEEQHVGFYVQPVLVLYNGEEIIYPIMQLQSTSHLTTTGVPYLPLAEYFLDEDRLKKFQSSKQVAIAPRPKTVMPKPVVPMPKTTIPPPKSTNSTDNPHISKEFTKMLEPAPAYAIRGNYTVLKESVHMVGKEMWWQRGNFLRQGFTAIEEVTYHPSCLLWSKDGKSFYAIHRNFGKIVKCSFPSMEVQTQLDIRREITWLSWCKDGILVTIPELQKCWLLDPDRLTMLRSFDSFQCLRIDGSQESNFAIGQNAIKSVVGVKRNLLLIDTRTGNVSAEMKTFAKENSCVLFRSHFAPDGKTFYVIDGVGINIIPISEEGTFGEKRECPSPKRLNHERNCMSTDGSHLAIVLASQGGLAQQFLRIYNTTTMEVVADDLPMRSTGGYYSIAIDPEKKRYYYNEGNLSTIHVCDFQGKELHSFPLTTIRPNNVHQLLLDKSGNQLLMLQETVRTPGQSVFGITLK